MTMPNLPARGADWLPWGTAIDDRLRGGLLPVAQFGFLPTATAAANETAWTNALAAAKTFNVPLYIGPGTYQKTTGLDLRASPTRADGIVLLGAGCRQTQIVVTTDTAELLQVGGYFHRLSDFSIRHTSFTPGASTGDGLVFYKAAYCSFKRLFIENCGNLVAIAQANVLEPGTSGSAGNYMFSCTFEDIVVNRYSKSGLFLRAFGAASTGSTWTNTYVQNGSPGSALGSTGAPVDLQGCDEMVFNQLNIEDHTGRDIMILLNQSAASITGLHFERIPLAGFNSAYMRVFGNSYLTVDGYTVSFSDVAAAGAGGVSSVFSVGAGGMVDARGGLFHDNTKTGGIGWTLAESDDTNANNSVRIGRPLVRNGAAFTSLTTSTFAEGIRQLGDTIYTA